MQIAFLHNSSDFSVFAGPHRNVEPEIGGELPVDVDVEGAVLFVFDCHGRVHFYKFVLSHSSVYLYTIDSREVGFRVFEQTFEGVVVGDQEQAFGVEVESSY